MWDEKSSGGNPMHSTYVHNPHYAFTADVSRPVQLQVTCQAAESIPINLKLIRRIGSPDSRIQQ